jgi:hypothetical protein
MLYFSEKICPESSSTSTSTTNISDANAAGPSFTGSISYSKNSIKVVETNTSTGKSHLSVVQCTDIVHKEEQESPSCISQTEIEWCGIPLGELTQSTPLCELPPVDPSKKHSVLYKLPLKDGSVPLPQPSELRDQWLSGFVRMPYSEKSVYPVKGVS